MNLPRCLPSLALVFAITTLPTMSDAAQPNPADRPPLRSQAFVWDKLEVRPTAVGQRRDVANQPTTTLAVFESHISTLNPGRASHAPHRHPEEELILVKEGTLDVHINGTTQRAGAGSVFFFGCNDAHAVSNVGDTPATYWVINLATAATRDESQRTASPTVRSAVHDWEKIKVETTKTGERRQILRGSTVTMNSLSVHATTVGPHTGAHGAHRHADDEIVIVKEGTIEATINGETHVAPPGSVLFFASNDLHGMRNIADTRATYYVIRVITSATRKASS